MTMKKMAPKPHESKSTFNQFSLSSRNCLGRNLEYLEMRLILAHMLMAFDFEISPDGASDSKMK